MKLRSVAYLIFCILWVSGGLLAQIPGTVYPFGFNGIFRFAAFTQTSNSEPAVASSAPFRGEAFVVKNPYLDTVPTLSYNSRQVGTFELLATDPRQFFLSVPFGSKAELDAAGGFPTGTYRFSNFGATLDHQLQTGGFPATPRVLDSGIWDSGGTLVNTSGMLKWTPVPSGTGTEHYVSVYNVDTQSFEVEDLSTGYDQTVLNIRDYITDLGTYRITLKRISRSYHLTGYSPVLGGERIGGSGSENTFLVRIEYPAHVPPVFTRQPQSQVLGSTGAFSPVVVETAPSLNMSYEWYQNNERISSLGTNILEPRFFHTGQPGGYFVIATNDYGSTKSEVFQLHRATFAGVDTVFIGKDSSFLQTGADSIIPAPVDPSTPNTGPNGFSVSVVGDHLDLLATPKFTPPANSTSSSIKDLDFYGASGVWGIGVFEGNLRYATEPELASLFPSGNYSVKVNSIPYPINIPAEALPVAPRFELTGGVWENGCFLVEKDTPFGVKTNAFNGFMSAGANRAEEIRLEYGAIEWSYESLTPGTPNFIDWNLTPDVNVNELDVAFIAYRDIRYNGTTGVTSASLLLSTTSVRVSVNPKITNHPDSQTISEGGDVTFFITATGTKAPGEESLRYVWKHNGTPIPGANLPTLTIPSVSGSDRGTYTCVVSNEFRSAISNGADLSVTLPPYPAYIESIGMTEAAIGGENDDHDGDGMTNLFEWAVGSDISAPSGNPLLTMEPATGNDPRSTVTFRRRKSAKNLFFTIEYSTSLASGSWIPAIPNYLTATYWPADIDDEFETVTAKVPIRAGNAFFRLRITR